MTQETLTTSPRLHYAGLGLRFLALVIDFAFLSLLFFPATRIIKGTWLLTSADHQWNYGWFISDPLCLTFLAFIVLYFVVFEGTVGATLGKRLTHLKIIRADGAPPNLKQALIRNLLRAVDALPAFSLLGIYLIATSPERVRFGDRVAGTRVVVISDRD